MSRMPHPLGMWASAESALSQREQELVVLLLMIISHLSGTESYVGDVALAVKVQDLSCGNLGKLWGRLKMNSSECPPWEKLKEAPFWKNAIQYQRVWDLLRGALRRPTGSLQEGAATGTGGVATATFDMTQEGKPVSKVAAWGSMQALIDHRKIHLVWAEVGSEGLPSGMEEVFEKHRDCNILLCGVEDGMFKAVGQLNAMKDKLWQYKTSMLHLHLKEDPPLGSRIPPHINVTRKILLASPVPLKPHRNFVCLDYPWRPSVLLLLLAHFDLPQRNVFHTMLYLPHSVRPASDVLLKMGQVLAQIPKWQVSFINPADSTDLDLTAQLRSVVLAAHSGVEQTDYERSVLARGMTLNSYSLFPAPPKPAGGSTPRKECAQELTPKKGEGAEAKEAEVRSPGGASVASPKGKGGGKGFKPPRRASDAQSSTSALERERRKLGHVCQQRHWKQTPRRMLSKKPSVQGQATPPPQQPKARRPRRQRVRHHQTAWT